jgi:hypothetical protein
MTHHQSAIPMRSSSSNTTISDLRGVVSIPSPPEFGAEVSIENHSCYPKPPREQDYYGHPWLVVARHGPLVPSGCERSIPLFVTGKETVKVLLSIY